MTPTHLQLQPFPTTPHPPLTLSALLDRSPSSINLTFTLTGPLDAILLPPLSATPARRDNLWQSTCLEAFIGPAGHPGYLELNVAPSGDWNLYRFSSYREGMSPVSDAHIEIREHHRTPDACTLSIGITLPPDFTSAPLEINLTAVIEDTAGRRSFWALSHGGERPDFHRRADFVARL